MSYLESHHSYLKIYCKKNYYSLIIEWCHEKNITVSQTTVLHMKRLNQTESPIFVTLCVIPLWLLFYSTVADVVPCGSRKVSPYIIIVQVIYYFLWLHPGYFENRIPLKPALGGVCSSQTTVLHMKRLNQTKSLIFLILFVLCFQKQSFLTFIINKSCHEKICEIH